MNLLKKFIRNDNADIEEDEYNDLYVTPEDLQTELSANDPEVAALDSPVRKDTEIHPVSADKVSLKLLQPKSHTEATRIADQVKEGCIVLLDISALTKDQAKRLVDFLAGVAYVLGGEMIKTNKDTIVVSPAGVDISAFAPDVVEEEEAGEGAEEISEEELPEDAEV